jgi:acetyl esterase
LVAQVSALGQQSLSERGVAAARAYLEERAAAGHPGPEVRSIEDENIFAHGRTLPVRVYRPDAITLSPVVVYLHGGGWVVGSVDASDAFCRRLVDAAGCVLVSVDYRLAPEDPFPAAVEDAVVAVTWAAQRAAGWNADTARLVVLGDSAGGNLATVAVRRVVDEGRIPICRQILAYPVTKADREPSTGGYGSQWPLTDGELSWFLDQYVTDDALRSDPDVAPLLADVTSMPPTTLLLGGCDPLFEEGMAYAERLWTAGVPVDLHVYAGQIHGFLTFDESILPRSREALGLVANAIRNS